mmetsp:Transcript_1991/g.4921  ORF Transcript_1991/g.4921 Transcript_1991/m.4921 type:complete len:382 (-) Transcript_1991:181-1326(-)
MLFSLVRPSLESAGIAKPGVRLIAQAVLRIVVMVDRDKVGRLLLPRIPGVEHLVRERSIEVHILEQPMPLREDRTERPHVKAVLLRIPQRVAVRIVDPLAPRILQDVVQRPLVHRRSRETHRPRVLRLGLRRIVPQEVRGILQVAPHQGRRRLREWMMGGVRHRPVLERPPRVPREVAPARDARRHRIPPLHGELAERRDVRVDVHAAVHSDHQKAPHVAAHGAGSYLGEYRQRPVLAQGGFADEAIHVLVVEEYELVLGIMVHQRQQGGVHGAAQPADRPRREDHPRDRIHLVLGRQVQPCGNVRRNGTEHAVVVGRAVGVHAARPLLRRVVAPFPLHQPIILVAHSSLRGRLGRDPDEAVIDYGGWPYCVSTGTAIVRM